MYINWDYVTNNIFIYYLVYCIIINSGEIRNFTKSVQILHKYFFSMNRCIEKNKIELHDINFFFLRTNISKFKNQLHNICAQFNIK